MNNFVFLRKNFCFVSLTKSNIFLTFNYSGKGNGLRERSCRHVTKEDGEINALLKKEEKIKKILKPTPRDPTK